MASLDFTHVGDDFAGALVGESADEKYQDCRDDRQQATLRRTWETKTQSDLSGKVMGRSVGSGDPMQPSGYFRATAPGDRSKAFICFPPQAPRLHCS